MIKRRFMSVATVCMIAPAFLWSFSESSDDPEVNYLSILSL